MHKTFAFAGYWLNPPPGADTNPWAGHRAALAAQGFGFLVLFNGRLEAELKRVADAGALGTKMRRAQPMRPRKKDSAPALRFFSIRKRAGRCSIRRWLTCSDGSPRWRSVDLRRVFTVRGSR